MRGSDHGHKCFSAIQESSPDDLIAKVQEATRRELDFPELIAQRQLEIRTSSEHLLSDDRFELSEIVESGMPPSVQRWQTDSTSFA